MVHTRFQETWQFFWGLQEVNDISTIVYEMTGVRDGKKHVIAYGIRGGPFCELMSYIGGLQRDTKGKYESVGIEFEVQRHER